jgi:DNA-binding response OmpR family regulator
MAARVLIVEDDPQFSYLLATLLQDQYQLLFAADGLEAIRTVEEQQPDLVILDLIMPRLDGWDTCRLIRKFSHVPILILSCRTGEQDRVQGLEIGADDYMTKPVSARELTARIHAILRRGDKPIVVEQIIDVDDRLRIDHTRQDAFVCGQPVKLSAKEYKLLSCLLDNARFVCTHRSLLIQVWGWEYADQSEYLKVYVHHLRKKIEADPQRPRYIHTERGKGYRFEPTQPGSSRNP